VALLREYEIAGKSDQAGREDAMGVSTVNYLMALTHSFSLAIFIV
jgi:hypothetical protein